MSKSNLEDAREAVRLALKENRFNDALSLLDSLQIEFPDFCQDNAQYVLAVADCHFELEHFPLALQSYQAASKLLPGHLSVNYNLLKCLVGMEQWNSINSQFEECLRLAKVEDIELVKYLYILEAEVAFRQKDMTKVYKALKKAAEHGAMDIDVMESNLLYNALSDDPQFEEIFD